MASVGKATVTSPHLGWLVVLLVVVLVACDRGAQGMIDVGDGRELYLACEGEGSPTVVMEAGGAGNSESWRFVQPDVTKFTRVCAYDRAGTGRSSSLPPHRTTRAIAEDLHALLAAADVHPPYVLVGHSLGGIIVHQFATEYPDDIVGMVMVDSSGVDPRDRLQAALTPEEWQQYGSTSHDPNFVFPEGPFLLVPDLRDIPLVVLSAGIVRSDAPPDVAKRIYDVQMEMQREVLGLSTNSTQVIVEDSDHAIPLNRPDLIADAIRQVVEAVRQDNP
ncbi:MAG: alpha/beta hydrolase [Chloroflexi bacterium]|nr:alpha/beta hydrolase [Chloroflexota bacterium]